MANSKFAKYENPIIIGIIITLAIFFAWLLFKPEKQAPPTIIKIVDLSEFRSIPMVNTGNLSFVVLKINSYNGLFLVDTGAEESIFNSTYLDSLKIAVADSTAIPNTQIVLTDTLHVSTLNDSLFQFKKPFYAYNLNGLKDKIIESDSSFKKNFFLGILGQDVMKQEGMILDFQNNKIYLTNKFNKIE